MKSAAADAFDEDLVQIDLSESEGHEHIGGNKSEGQHTCHCSAVKFQFVKKGQQRRDQNRDKGDVDRDHILGRNGGKCQDPQKHILEKEDIFWGRLFVEPFEKHFCQKFRDPGAGDGDGKSPQHGVAESDLSPLHES